jgi:hypothetical protein
MHILPLLIILILFSEDRNREWEPRVTLHAEDAPLTEVLEDIRRQAGIRVELDEDAQAVLGQSRKVRLIVSDVSVRSALTLLFKPLAPNLNEIWKGQRNVLITVCRLAERER